MREVRQDAMQQKRDQDGGVEALRGELRMTLRLLTQLEHQPISHATPLPPSYAQALMVLRSFEQRQLQPTLTELVELLGIDKSNVTRLCQRMVEEGHVHIGRDERDRRAKRIRLTAAGAALAERVNEVSVGRYARLAEALGGVEAARELCDRLNSAIKSMA